MDSDRFTVTEDHLKLLRKAYVDWNDCEFGAPAIDCKRPYGNSDVIGDISEIIGIKPLTNKHGERFFTDQQYAVMEALHKETQTVLQIALLTGRFEAGTYVREPWPAGWKLEEGQ